MKTVKITKIKRLKRPIVRVDDKKALEYVSSGLGEYVAKKLFKTQEAQQDDK